MRQKAPSLQTNLLLENTVVQKQNIITKQLKFQLGFLVLTHFELLYSALYTTLFFHNSCTNCNTAHLTNKKPSMTFEQTMHTYYEKPVLLFSFHVCTFKVIYLLVTFTYYIYLHFIQVYL